MLLAYLFFTTLLLNSAWGYLEPVEFESYLDPMCVSFNADEQPLVNGQEYPLAQTLENFIALAEKFEVANPNYGLKNELFYFVRNYTYNNIEFSSLGDVTVFEPAESNFDIVRTLWEPDQSQRVRHPEAQDPFTDAEKCSLFYMLSHSIVRTPRKVTSMRSSTNNSRRGYNDIRFNLEEMYPLEMGVVAIRGSERAVDLGRVLRGIYVGLRESRRISIESFERIPRNVLSVDMEKMIDPLYTLTIAEVISLATWRPEVGKRSKFPESEGYWASTDPNTKDICPMLYRLKNGTNAFESQSSLRGAVDGFILGRIIGNIEKTHKNVRLSQILRMYYSRGGISSKDDEMGQTWASFCNRESFLAPLESTLKDQTRLYLVLASRGYKSVEDNVNFALDFFNQQRSGVITNRWSTDLDTYCSKPMSVNEVQDLPLETPLDIIAVLDTSDGEENYRKQQLILGYMAKEMDLRHLGSRMTVLTDQKMTNTLSSTTGTVHLKSVVFDSHSSSCVACRVVQIPKDELTSAPEDEVLIAIDQLLEEKKKNETSRSGVEGKVVIYFNFHAGDPSSRPTALQARVERALRDLHIRHIDVSMYALGKDQEFVKKYGRNDIAFVMSAVDETEKVVGKKLFEKVSAAPATLQYGDCVDGKGENTAIYEDFVSPNTIQHWAMPAKYFYKSGHLKLQFEANYGPIRVCHNRATRSPEQEKSSCTDIENGQKFEYKHSNPCKRLNDITCSPFYFAVIGVNTTEGARQDCIDSVTNAENQCRTLDQIKFKVSHEGIRCNGSSSVVAVPFLLFLVLILQSVLSKRW